MLSKKGFSLVELLVIITIIMVISTIGIFVFSQGRLGGKDSKRKTDLTEIAQAVELYYQANKIYPGTVGLWYCSFAGFPCSGSIPDPWIPNLVPNYIQSLPLDPTQNSTYRYLYFSVPQSSGSPTTPSCPNLSNGQFYILAAMLEAPGDKDSIGVKVVRDCNNLPINTYQPFNSSPNWYVLTTP